MYEEEGYQFIYYLIIFPLLRARLAAWQHS